MAIIGTTDIVLGEVDR
ncbi:MAG: hypothetical protein ACLGI9_24400 [Thermoanaerobaculia bacterium]